MRLWHQSLIPYLDRQRLLGQHRECCALRGKGWGKKHSVVDYVFTYEPDYLIAYHFLIIEEMIKRGYNPNGVWLNPNWRGDVIGMDNWVKRVDEYAIYQQLLSAAKEHNTMIFPEHNEKYLQDCINNLKEKGIEIKMGDI